MANIDGLIFDELIDSQRIRVSDSNAWRYKVLMAIADAGDHGATDNELADLLQAPGGQNNIRPRRGELVDSGFLVDSGSKRRTSSGSQATVWRLSNKDRSTLTPVFTESDCDLAGRMAAAADGSHALSQQDRQAGERLRARFALLGRRARRESAALGTPVEVDVERPGRVSQSLWRADSDRGRLQVAAELDDEGMHIHLDIGSADTSEADSDVRNQRFRSELANLPEATTSRMDALLKHDWHLSTVVADDRTPFSSTREWIKALVAEPAAVGRISRTLNPQALAQAGDAASDVLTQFLQVVLPIDAAAEAAMRDPIQALVNGLFWDEERARNLIGLSRRARQLLFAGPPGTGKTLAARTLASALADQSRVKLVQFHPTYAYEDFVEGIRPSLNEEVAVSVDEIITADHDKASAGLQYRMRPGVFKQIVNDARLAGGEVPHFLIIDEINRANLPRVLGELLFALEYRGPDNQVELAYSAEPFYVPENLWIIGTMNTADRSVALMDAAMRRRFKEVRFDVDYTALRRWHERNTSAELGAEAEARLRRLNADVVELLDEDRAIGHSYLIRHDLADVGFEAIWSEDLEPVLRDHLLGRTDDLPTLSEAFLGTL